MKREDFGMTQQGQNMPISQGTDILMQNLDLREAAQILRRRSKLIFSMIAGGCLVAILISMMITPQYKSSSIVMINNRKTNILSFDSVLSGLPADNAALRSEMDIITSRAIIDRVIDKLHLTNDPEFYREKTSSFSLNPVNWFTEEKKISPEEKATLIKSSVAKAVEKRLSVDNDGRSFSIKISFESKDQNKAALITNTFADEYLVDQLETKYDETQRANKWLSERLDNLRRQVEISEKATQDFRERKNLLRVDGSTIMEQQMKAVSSQLVTARTETKAAEARVKSAADMLKTGGVDAAADVLASPLIQRLREQEAQVRRNEADLSTRYGDKHPQMIHARAEYADLQNKIAEEVQKIIRGFNNQVDIAKATEGQLQKELEKIQTQAGSELRNTVTLSQLQREADANRTLYENFLSRFKQTGEQSNMQTADARVIAKADPSPNASFPNKSLFAIVGAIIGFILGLLMTYLIEYFDRGFRNMPQIEKVTGFPAIGLVPSLKGTTEISPQTYIIQKPLSAFSEALRTVRTAIEFSNVDNPPKVVMVTSSLPGEGKTTFCLCMARALGKAGNKILLIDADLRRPRIHTMMTGEKKAVFEHNLASLLSGHSTLEQTIQQDSDIPNVFFIPASENTPNSQDVLASHQMEKLVREVKEMYDMVIIDTPPILAVSDAAMIARVVDTSLFIVHWAETPREATMRALKQLALFNCKIAGIVLNQVNMTEYAHYGYNEYGYYYNRYNDYYTN